MISFSFLFVNSPTVSFYSSYLKPYLVSSQIRWKNMRVQQQDLPERGNIPSKLQTPVHLHGRSSWMCLTLPSPAHAAQTGLCQAPEGEGSGSVL